MGKGRRIKEKRILQESVNSQKKNSLKRWVVIGSIPAIVLGYGIYQAYHYFIGKTVPIIMESKDTSAPSLEKIIESPLQIARRDYTRRREYLNNLLRGVNISYCSEVVYDHDGSKILEYIKSGASQSGLKGQKIEETMKQYEARFRGGFYDAKTPEILELSGMNKSSKIFLGRMLFEIPNPLNDEEFKHIIVAHEGRHCIQHAKGLGYLEKNQLIEGVHSSLIEQRVVYEIAELDANYHGLKRILSGEFRVSKGFFEHTKKEFTRNYLRLQSVLEGSSDIQKQLIINAFEGVRDLDLSKLEQFVPLSSGY